VYGEGEPVFPLVLRSLRTGARTDFSNVAWRTASGFVWGRHPPPAFDLSKHLPPPRDPLWRPDSRGMVYLEVGRGCPLRCAFCCYGQRRRRISLLPADEVAERIRAALERGARDIRFVDPTFNARPDFERMIASIAELNRGRQAQLFAELRGETISSAQARTLARAGFREVEVGMQTRDPETLRLIHRPTRLRALDRGIRRLARAGIRVTVDLMYGLPQQTARDVRRMIGWAARQRGIRIQCLQTLLLPGTELRGRRREWKMTADQYPPYAVRATATLSEHEMREAEKLVRRRLRIVWDCPTGRFVGRTLPDLFAERLRTAAERISQARLKARTDRCAVIVEGNDLFGARSQICAAVRRAVEEEPHILWQFVLAPEYEEPLDLLDELAREIHALPDHVLDRFIQLHSPGLRASRRLFVWLRPGRRYARDWQRAAEDLLRGYFY
jgi:molybdenum cofactor biosynthesis enzyme MoaA